MEFKKSTGYMSNLVKKCQLEMSCRNQVYFPTAVALLGNDDIQRLSLTARAPVVYLLFLSSPVSEGDVWVSPAKKKEIAFLREKTSADPKRQTVLFNLCISSFLPATDLQH